MILKVPVFHWDDDETHAFDNYILKLNANSMKKKSLQVYPYRENISKTDWTCSV